MAKTEGQKQKLLLLKELLERESDAEHPVTTRRMLEYLAAHGIHAERKSIYDDIRCLQDYGMDILCIHGKNGGYYLTARLFELPELKLLVDAVQSSRFLTEKKSLELIEKLGHLASTYEAQQLRREVVVSGRVKTMNESIYYNVDQIQTAISGNSRIRFRYFDWGMDRQKHYRDRIYDADPLHLCWADEKYYLIAYSLPHGITHYRVDKMADIVSTGEARSREAMSQNVDPAAYSSAVFAMFHGEPTRVRMRFEQSLAGVVIDRFGQDSILVPDGEDHFTFSAEIAVSPTFLGWMAGFGSRAEILYPPSLRQTFQEQLERILALYRDEESKRR